MDLAILAETTAALVATGAAQGVGEHVATSAFSGMVRRIREVFRADRRALQSLDETVATGDETAARDLTAALRWYAERDETFAADLDRWAGSGVAQQVRAGRDAYVAGRDQTVTHNHFGD
ncbi:hypothetical protein OG417_24940 [Actinoallomurus sp. NBC_01490]|uniref:hypothetical protein n=1 Tax=Actinoallomurus sp. NBC_01490 TaxID=2903557 RepID=UPI002E2F6D65|nr:hypothetical protein [Actinoallomurus sp. NBC_01490]